MNKQINTVIIIFMLSRENCKRHAIDGLDFNNQVNPSLFLHPASSQAPNTCLMIASFRTWSVQHISGPGRRGFSVQD